MQARFRFSALLFMAAVFIISSCSTKTNTQGRYIPKNAVIVVHINGETVSAKLPWDEVKQNELFKTVYTDTTIDAYIKTALDNPDNTGVDTKKDLLFFAQKDSIGGYVAIEGMLKDAAKFKQFHTGMAKNVTETEKDGLHFLSHEKMGMAWDKERFVLIIDAPKLNDLNKFRNTYDSTPVTKRDMNAVCAQIFAMKEENSLAKDEKFSSLMSDKGDVHFWMNIEALNQGLPAMAALSMLNINKLVEGSLVTSTVNFENGKIKVDIKSYSGKEMSDLWKKYSGSSINTEMIKRVPAKDVAGLFAMNFKPEGIRELIRLAGMEGFANMGTAFLGFNLDDFIKANKGDILLCVSDIKMDSLEKTKANILFSASVNDKNAFGKLIDAGKKLGSDRYGYGGPPSVFYNTSDNFFAIGSNKETVDQYISKAGNSNFDFLDKISGSPMGTYINFQYIMNSMKPQIGKDSLHIAAFDATLKMWDNLVATGGNYKDGGVSQHIEINLVDKTTNSLKQLNKYAGVMGKIEEARRHAHNDYNWSEEKGDDITVDTTATR